MGPEHIKTQATETLAAMGLTVSDAVRAFLTRVVVGSRAVPPRPSDRTKVTSFLIYRL